MSYQGSFNRGKISIFLYLKMFECIVFIRILDRYKEQPKEYKYHNPYDDWIFRQLADIDNRKNIPNTSPQVDFNEGDYEDYLKAKWNRGL